jgi:hypothetical protein
MPQRVRSSLREGSRAEGVCLADSGKGTDHSSRSEDAFQILRELGCNCVELRQLAFLKLGLVVLQVFPDREFGPCSNNLFSAACCAAHAVFRTRFSASRKSARTRGSRSSDRSNSSKELNSPIPFVRRTETAGFFEDSGFVNVFRITFSE